MISMTLTRIGLYRNERSCQKHHNDITLTGHEITASQALPHDNMTGDFPRSDGSFYTYTRTRTGHSHSVERTLVVSLLLLL